MNGNRVPWTISIVALAVALIACFVALSPRVAAQDEPIPAEPVVAVPVEGELAVEPALVDPAAVDAAVSPAFTYQGVLRSGSAPANGSYDFQFSLYNAVTGGTKRGPTLVSENVAVSQGRLTTILNFGNVYGNEALWIAVGVRSGTSTGAFTALNPRQSLTAAPFAASTPALAARVAALEALLAGVTRVDGGSTIRITNANLQVVSGSGMTNGVVNGRGNIIVGYNEPNSAYPAKSGSHMLVVGIGHNYSSYGGAVFGTYNRAIAPYANVLGGTGNWSNGIATVAVGGEGNHPQGSYTVVVGGYGNVTTNQRSVVVGGLHNKATGPGSATTGGMNNTASGDGSVVAGGNTNEAEGATSFVGGGAYNTAEANDSVVAGGQSNAARGIRSVVCGGYNHILTAEYATYCESSSGSALE